MQSCSQRVGSSLHALLALSAHLHRALLDDPSIVSLMASLTWPSAAPSSTVRSMKRTSWHDLPCACTQSSTKEQTAVMAAKVLECLTSELGPNV
eukprot:12617035-Alexandrium_andersonii.AAC.1